jgi:hypothetical protein
VKIDVHLPDLPRPRNRAGWSALVDLATIGLGLALVGALWFLATVLTETPRNVAASSPATAAADAVTQASSHLARCQVCQASGLTAEELAEPTRPSPCAVAASGTDAGGPTDVP